MLKLNNIYHGDCLDLLKQLDDNSIDSIITDPPYGIRFMHGKGRNNWDYELPSVEVWKECLRVAKPGAILLCFGGDRTFHRLAVNIEDAGWELKQTLCWVYGSGMPKSQNIGEMMEKKAGIKRPVIGKYSPPNGNEWNLKQADGSDIEHKPGAFTGSGTRTLDITGPVTDEGRIWNGHKTVSLKPAWEPILMFQKPLDGTYIENCRKWNCGGLNIENARILVEGKDEGGRYPSNFILGCTCGVGEEHDIECPISIMDEQSGTTKSGAMKHEVDGYDGESNTGMIRGRSGPSNQHGDEGGASRFFKQVKIEHDENCPIRMLDEQSGDCSSPRVGNPNRGNRSGRSFGGGEYKEGIERTDFADKGSASRFFYCAKASPSERNMGCSNLDDKEHELHINKTIRRCLVHNEPVDSGTNNYTCGCKIKHEKTREKMLSKNDHPTVKPLSLMVYLCNLTSTPFEGIVLDPFCGSGTTLMAAKKTGRPYIGFELDEHYIEIANVRLSAIEGMDEDSDEDERSKQFELKLE